MILSATYILLSYLTKGGTEPRCISPGLLFPLRPVRKCRFTFNPLPARCITVTLPVRPPGTPNSRALRAYPSSSTRVSTRSTAAQSVIPRHLVPEPIRHRPRIETAPRRVRTRRTSGTPGTRARSGTVGAASRAAIVWCDPGRAVVCVSLASGQSWMVLPVSRAHQASGGTRGSAQGTSAAHVSVACCCRAGVDRTGSKTFGEHVVMTETRI